jgi:hypothetical protein
MGILSEMNKTGDNKIQWDPKDDMATARARTEFDKRMKSGWKAYRVNHRGGRGEVITEFDPFAYEIVFHKIMAGG